MLPKLDIAVAGAGIAGLSAALFLNAQGHRVVLFDQFEVPRPVGSGLVMQPTGLAVMDALGLGDELRALGRPIERMVGLSMPSGRTVLDVAYDPSGQERIGLAIHRAGLFGVLYRATVRAGIAFEAGHRVSGLISGERTWLTCENGTRHGPFDLVVDALGSRSPLRAHQPLPRQLVYGALWTTVDWPEHGFAANRLEQRYVKAHTMAGVLPTGRIDEGAREQGALFWSLRASAYPDWQKRGLNAWKHDVLTLWPQTEPLLDGITSAEQLTMATYTHFTDPRPGARGIVHLGDAAHATSPQLGQGANMALLDSAALAIALLNEASVDTVIEAYCDMRKWHVRFYQVISAIFTPFYQSDSSALAWVRDHVMWPLSRIPPGPDVLAALVRGHILPALHGMPTFERTLADLCRVQPALLSTTS
jgi:2-polyprenyl-6-methoxyphenol hydroxylase-like FAD-dependent oxidoreductase